MRIMRRDGIGSSALSLLFPCGLQFVRIDVVVNGSKSDIRRRHYFSFQWDIYELGFANFVVCRVQSRAEHATCELEKENSNLSVRLRLLPKSRAECYTLPPQIFRAGINHCLRFVFANPMFPMHARSSRSVGIRRRVFSL